MTISQDIEKLLTDLQAQQPVNQVQITVRLSPAQAEHQQALFALASANSANRKQAMNNFLASAEKVRDE